MLKKGTFKDQDYFILGQRFRSEPIPPKVVHPIFTSGLSTNRSSFALEKGYCPSHWQCVLGQKETQVHVTDDTAFFEWCHCLLCAWVARFFYTEILSVLLWQEKPNSPFACWLHAIVPSQSRASFGSVLEIHTSKLHAGSRICLCTFLPLSTIL